MTQINDDRLAYYRTALATTTGTLMDLEYQWLVAQGATPGPIPDMWRQYLIAGGYGSEINEGIAKLAYPLNQGKGRSN